VIGTHKIEWDSEADTIEIKTYGSQPERTGNGGYSGSRMVAWPHRCIWYGRFAQFGQGELIKCLSLQTIMDLTLNILQN
jgi:hypothetical protein